VKEKKPSRATSKELREGGGGRRGGGFKEKVKGGGVRGSRYI
jgi:hypothetical protein